MKKKFFNLCVIVIIAFLFMVMMGCKKESKNVTLKFLDTYGGMIEEMIKVYEEQNPNIHIEYEYVPADKYYAKFTTLSISNSSPDIVWTNTGYLVEQVKADLLVDLTKELKSGKNYEGDKIWGETFIPKLIQNSRDILGVLGSEYTQKSYGVPFTMTTVAIIYDKALFDKNGLKKPTTWEEFEALNNKIKELGLIPISMQQQNIDWWPRILWDQFCREKLDADPKAFENGSMTFSSKEVREGLEAFKSMYDKGWFPDSSLTAKREEMVQLFVQKKMPQALLQSQYLDYITKNVPSDVQVASYALPGIAGFPSRCLGGASDVWAVTKASEYQEEAIHFIKFITSATAFSQDYARFVTPCISLDKSDSDDPVLDGFLEAGKYGFVPEIYVPVNATPELKTSFMNDFLPNYLIGKYKIDYVSEKLNSIYKDSYLSKKK